MLRYVLLQTNVIMQEVRKQGKSNRGKKEKKEKDKKQKAGGGKENDDDRGPGQEKEDTCVT